MKNCTSAITALATLAAIVSSSAASADTSAAESSQPVFSIDAPHLAALCKTNSIACRIYVQAVLDTVDVYRFKHLPYFKISSDKPGSIQGLLDRINAFNATHPYNLQPYRSGAVMVIEALGMTENKSAAQ
jgi:hypothetical protein